MSALQQANFLLSCAQLACCAAICAAAAQPRATTNYLVVQETGGAAATPASDGFKMPFIAAPPPQSMADR